MRNGERALWSSLALAGTLVGLVASAGRSWLGLTMVPTIALIALAVPVALVISFVLSEAILVRVNRRRPERFPNPEQVGSLVERGGKSL